MFRYYFIRDDMAMPVGLYAGLCHTFLVLKYAFLLICLIVMNFDILLYMLQGV